MNTPHSPLGRPGSDSRINRRQPQYADPKKFQAPNDVQKIYNTLTPREQERAACYDWLTIEDLNGFIDGNYGPLKSVSYHQISPTKIIVRADFKDEYNRPTIVIGQTNFKGMDDMLNLPGQKEIHVSAGDFNDIVTDSRHSKHYHLKGGQSYIGAIQQSIGNPWDKNNVTVHSGANLVKIIKPVQGNDLTIQFNNGSGVSSVKLNDLREKQSPFVVTFQPNDPTPVKKIPTKDTGLNPNPYLNPYSNPYSNPYLNPYLANPLMDPTNNIQKETWGQNHQADPYRSNQLGYNNPYYPYLNQGNLHQKNLVDPHNKTGTPTKTYQRPGTPARPGGSPDPETTFRATTPAAPKNAFVINRSKAVVSLNQFEDGTVKSATMIPYDTNEKQYLPSEAKMLPIETTATPKGQQASFDLGFWSFQGKPVEVTFVNNKAPSMMDSITFVKNTSTLELSAYDQDGDTNGFGPSAFMVYLPKGYVNNGPVEFDATNGQYYVEISGKRGKSKDATFHATLDLDLLPVDGTTNPSDKIKVDVSFRDAMGAISKPVALEVGVKDSIYRRAAKEMLDKFLNSGSSKLA